MDKEINGAILSPSFVAKSFENLRIPVGQSLTT